MKFPSIASQAFGAVVIAAMMPASSNAQVARTAQGSSASKVAAEMTKGKLNPAQTKPGDQVVLQLKGDIKSNGVVLLKKGTSISGVVRNVKTAEGTGPTAGQARSMVHIDWLVPAAPGKGAQQVSIALQSVAHINRLYQPRVAESSEQTAPGVVSTVSNTAVLSSSSSSSASGQSNKALLNMPSVLAADHDTAVSLEKDFGLSSSGQLFKVGHGELVSSGGYKQSVDLFSHFNNDTVITSQERSFEISSGAQMQLLVGVRK